MSATPSRMLALLSLLQTTRVWPGAVLADRLEVTPRTLRRDIDRLRELGYRITSGKGPGSGYRLAAGSELPPLLFDEQQAVAIAVALQHVPATGIDIDEGAARALATVRQVMPSALRHRVDGIRFSRAEIAVTVSPAVLEAASAAVKEHRVLRFDYGDTDRPPRRTEPHAVVARDGRWYLVAWDVDVDGWRLFRLDRMTPRVPTGPSFTPRPLPADDAASYVAARFKGSSSEDRWPCTGEVEIALPAASVAPWLDEEGSVVAIDETRCRVRIGSWSWMGVLAALARFDADFTVIDPPELTDAATALARRLHHPDVSPTR